MPRAPTKAAASLRNAAIRLDRASGRSMRAIAKERGLSVSMVHRIARDVHIQLPSKWHLARLPKDEPLPHLECVHALLAPR